MTKYLGEFITDKTKYPLIKDSSIHWYNGFELTPNQIIEIANIDIIIAAYNKESYEGDAFILFKKDGKLYEVNDSHCSCNGLEHWEPEEVTKKALLLRLNREYGCFKEFNTELREIIEKL